MRIVSEWNLERYKCTLMVYEMKYTLQIEDERLQLTYKMGDRRREEIQKLEEILATPEVFEQIKKSFGALYDTSYLIDKNMSIEEEDLPTIL